MYIFYFYINEDRGTCHNAQRNIFSFHVLLFCLALQIVGEGLRVDIPPGVSQHMAKLIKICMNEDPAKRPRFDMLLPIMEKMRV